MNQLIPILLILNIGLIWTSKLPTLLEVREMASAIMNKTNSTGRECIQAQLHDQFVKEFPARSEDIGIKPVNNISFAVTFKEGAPCFPQYPGEFENYTEFERKQGISSNYTSEQLQIMFCHSLACLPGSTSDAPKTCASCELIPKEALERFAWYGVCQTLWNGTCVNGTGKLGLSYWTLIIPGMFFIFQALWA